MAMTDDEADLKPCPCCGGRAWRDANEHYNTFEGHRMFYSIRCVRCDLRTKSVADPQQPRKIWNKRPDN